MQRVLGIPAPTVGSQAAAGRSAVATSHRPTLRMPLSLPSGGPTLAVRRDAFERAGLTRELLDQALNLTDNEFRVEGALIAIGPLPGPDDVPDLIEQFEESGLVYFDDFVEIPGGFPEWLELFARHR
jgi:hypothetical protein